MSPADGGDSLGDLDAEQILEGLNPEQRAAVETARGPLCILAGAGTGKTTTITRRIAWQVASGAFPPQQIVAVTFTDKAAGELRTRLRALGVDGVRASTFHSAALSLLRHFQGDPGRILASKAILLRRIGNGLPGAYRFRPAGDLATEIEWAKNRRLTPDTYRDWLGDHEPPIPPDLCSGCSASTSGARRPRGCSISRTCSSARRGCSRPTTTVRAAVHDRWRAFTVDEYQDVNLLQQSLLDLWLGERDDLCAVGDDYQAIYGFTGASAEWLLALPRRFPHAHVVRLERNYRSTRAGDRAGEPARAAARRLGEDARADARGRPRAGRRAGAERRRARAAAARRRAAARADGGARAHERAHERVRGGVPRRRDPVPGRVAARPRRGSAAAEGAARPARARRRGRARARRPPGAPRRGAGQARRARADAAGRPGAARAARRGLRRRGRRLRRAAARALRRERGPRRPPADAPPREGPRVGRRLPAARRGGRAAGPPRRRRRRSGVSSTSG